MLGASSSNKLNGIGITPQDVAQSVDIGEIEFHHPIVKLATGRSHVLALDSKGRVWSWGTNDKG